MCRVTVIRDEQHVPLFPDQPVRATTISPLRGLIVERHNVGAIEIPEHLHMTPCLQLQTSGPVKMEWWSDGRHGEEISDEGSLITLGPGTRGRLRWSGPSGRILVSIDETIMQRAAEELGKTDVPSFTTNWNLHDHQLKLLITEIDREMESGWSTGLLYGDLLGMAFAVALLQKCTGETNSTPPVRGGLHPMRLKRVIEYIEANLAREVRLTDLARVATMSHFHFARVFRSSIGVTPHQFLMERRVDRAKTLLLLGRRTITEIAHECGYPSGGHLARAFRKSVGASPTEWRNKL
jgi:AraC family transcriptional regulator